MSSPLPRRARSVGPRISWEVRSSDNIGGSSKAVPRGVSLPPPPARKIADIVSRARSALHPEINPRPHETIFMDDWIRMKIEVPRIYWGILYTNMLASLFTWLLLSGFVVLPVTFSSLRTSRVLNGLGTAGGIVVSAVQNIPFLAVAASCFVCGIAGLLWIWWENRRNYIWLADRIFLPALLNSFIGLITTLVNVYTTQGGHWSVTAIITAAITASMGAFAVAPYILYTLWAELAYKEHCEINRGYLAH